jgi:hypothetical protein
MCPMCLCVKKSLLAATKVADYINFKSMITSRHLMSDTEILCLIEHKNFLGWQCLYNKYALMMYVGILWITDDKILAEEIMSHLFVQLKTDKTLLNTKLTLCSSLLYHTYAISYKMLKVNEMRCGKHNIQLDSCPSLIDLMNDATALTEAEAKGKLRLEIHEIRDRYAQKIKEQTAKKQAKESVVAFDFY